MSLTRQLIVAWILVFGLVSAQAIQAGHYHNADVHELDVHGVDEHELDPLGCAICSVDTNKDVYLTDFSHLLHELPCSDNRFCFYTQHLAQSDFSLAHARAPPSL